MRYATPVALVVLAACGSPGPRELSQRAPSPEAGAVPTFVEPESPYFISDPSCGPDVVPPAPAGRFPGPCSIVRDAGPYPAAEGVWEEQYTYDDAGREVSWTNDYEHRSRVYDDAGRLLTKLDCGGSCCTGFEATYDDAGRLSALWEDECTDNEWFDYHYDDAGRLSTADYHGFVIEDATLRYEVDDAGSPTAIVWQFPDGGTLETEAITYDGAGRPLEHDWEAANPHVMPSGPALGLSGVVTERWHYDDAGHVLSDVISTPTDTLSEDTYRYERGVPVAHHAEQLYGRPSTRDESWTYCNNGQVHEHRFESTFTEPSGAKGEGFRDDVFSYGPWGLWTVHQDRAPTVPVVEKRTFDAAGNVLQRVDQAGLWTYDYSCWSR